MKEFNTTGVCIPEKHYMADVSKKINAIEKMVEAGKYFTINKPRQSGKTTILYLLEKKLLNDDFIPILISFEGIGDEVFNSEKVFIKAFINLMKKDLSFNFNQNKEYKEHELEVNNKKILKKMHINKMVPPVGVEPTPAASESFVEVPYISSFLYNPCHNGNLMLEISHIVVKYCIFYCGI